jgi:hypothetical protein
MKYLIPIGISLDSRAALEHVERAARGAAAVEVVLLNVQPRFHRHIAQFSRKSDRDALRAERGRAAMAQAAGRLSLAGVPFRLMVETGDRGERIAAVAAAERVDEILDRGEPQGVLERYAIPVGIAGLAALILAAE